MNVSIIGSSNYQNILSLKEFLFYLKNKYKDELSIISSGEDNGAPKMVKGLCQKLNIHYIEVPPFTNSWNIYCTGNGIQKYMYGRKYSHKYKFMQYNQIVKLSDIIVILNAKLGKFKMNEYVIERCKKLNKKYMVRSE